MMNYWNVTDIIIRWHNPNNPIGLSPLFIVSPSENHQAAIGKCFTSQLLPGIRMDQVIVSGSVCRSRLPTDIQKTPHGKVLN